MCKIGKFGSSEDWFKAGLRKLVGNGHYTLFWHDPWTRQMNLETQFERLFSISECKDFSIADMGTWSDGSRTWKFTWRRNLFIWEEGLLEELMA